ncbi:SOS response-associated peptidase [Pedobacter sp. MC2016-05]|uniref:SOS response-associated peptidase n=1 Tax=Pedobacter sp. MC2016-05 TaxID=2994474 RepID=UPI0022461288|nr:SOS response-associated peptidase [Pedobacter sp. MC2016-05]MCX2473552.1 SOS response-associated peptidase [Pedobacter sp. MC2016-05]
MCYRATQTSKAYEYADYYKAQLNPEKQIEDQVYYHANGFSHPNLVTIAAKEGERQAERMQWGLMPNWKKPLPDMIKLSNNTLNAKSETIFDLASFKGSIMTKRCILPVEGFFEYKEVDKDKLPYFIHPKEHPYFNIACIYAFYQNPENQEWIKSFSIITGPANELMTDIHNTKFRQPLIISNDQITNWLDPNTSKEEIIHLMNPCDDSNMAAYRVDRQLIKIGNAPEALLAI